MGQRIYAAPAPDGWSDREETWLSADLVWKRIEFAQTFASRIMRRGLDPLELGEAVLGPLFSADTRESIRQAESGTQGLAILLAAPEFQRR
jgi:uncharacterized protein (DUF1800 family)